MWSNGSQPESFDTYADTLLPPGLLKAFLSDVNYPPMAKTATPCNFNQARSDDDVEKLRKLPLSLLNVVNFCNLIGQVEVF